MTPTPRVAISDDFLVAFSRLSKTLQKKVRAFTEKFRMDPTSSAINYERIHNMRDEKVRTVRIDQAYRAIIIHPPAGDVYLLVWVDHHDEAMDWAKRKRFDVHPSTGSLQIYEVQTDMDAPLDDQPAEAPSVPTPTVDAATGDIIPAGRLFQGVHQDDLFILGIPTPLFPAVRSVRTEAHLLDLLPYLPPEASDALFLLASGNTPEQVMAELDRSRKAAASVDVTNFEQALQHPDSRSRFRLVESESDLSDILSKPLAMWRIFLHPSQQKVVDWDVSGPVRVLGGAGTGKTVAAMHRARYLAQKHASNPDARILFTTYTRNLADEIGHNMTELCSPEERKRIDVINLHQWANQFLQSQGIELKLITNKRLQEIWREVLDAPDAPKDWSSAFFQEEWKYVIQSQDVLDLAGYLSANRVGRGTQLSRKQQAEVWKVMEAYRAALDKEGVHEQDDVIREARLLLERHPDRPPYVSVVADEVQDFRQADLRLLRTMVPEGRNDLFLVGDAHQRIYRHRATLGAAGIHINGHSQRLRVNYRTTEHIRNFAVALVEGVSVDDLDGGLDTNQGYHSLREGDEPIVRTFPSQPAESAFLIEQLRRWMGRYKPRAICVAARTNKLIEEVYAPALRQAGIEHVVVKTEAEARLGDGVRLCTMHRMKGLEFPCVLLASFNDGVMPLRLSDDKLGDLASRADHEQSERCLAHVAATRARDHLTITCFGEPSPILRPALET